MIDILIPTYNREQELIKNLKHLNEMILSENLENQFRILVSDNCSTDNTWGIINEIGSKIGIELIKFKQDSNVGLERNAVFLLQKATSEFIMYIGDDDYLPKDYLTFVVDIIKEDSNVCSVIPGFDELYADGSTKPGRKAKFNRKKYLPGFVSALKLSYFGHQLSGLLLRRNELEEKYLRDSNYRNIYPFIFFLSHNILRGSSYYVPIHKVLVSQSNSKDWEYDDSGLLTEMFKNFHILFPNSPLKRQLLAYSILKSQGAWRLRMGKNFFLALKAMVHVWKSETTDFLIKLIVPLIIIYLYLRKILSFLKEMIVKSYYASSFSEKYR